MSRASAKLHRWQQAMKRVTFAGCLARSEVIASSVHACLAESVRLCNNSGLKVNVVT